MLHSALALLGAMSAILLTWAILAVWVSAIGLSVARLGLRSCRWDSIALQAGSVLAEPSECSFGAPLLTAPWLGLAVLLEFLQLWHLFLPVNGFAFLVVAIGGSIAAASNVKWGVQWIYHNRTSWGAFGLPFMLAEIWLANRAVGPCIQYDSAFYHLAGIRWANEFAIEKGLGNLFPPFALNNSNLLLNAMMEFGPWRGRSSHVFNGFFAAMMVPVIISGCKSVLVQRGRRAAGGLFAALTSVMLVKYAVTSDLASPSTDMPAALFGLFAGWRLFRMLLRLPRSAREWDYDLLLTTAVLAATLTLKLSAIFFVSIAWVICVGAWMRWRNGRQDGGGLAPRLAKLWFPLPVLRERVRVRARSKLPEKTLTPALSRSTGRGSKTTGNPTDGSRALATSVILSAALIGTWIARGYLLSGFPLFPSAIGGIHVDWRVGEPARLNDIAALERVNKTTYLNRNADISGFHWARGWFIDTFLIRSGAESVLPAGVAIGAVLLALWAGKDRGKSAQRVRSARNAGWILMIPASVALIVWFVKVPAPRMGAMPWWIVAATAAAMAMLQLKMTRNRRHRRSILYACAALAVLPLLHMAALIQFRYRHDPFMAYYGVPAWRVIPFYGAGPDHGFYPLRNPDLIEVHTDSGLRVYMPKPPGQDLWYAPLPGTPELDPKLHLRKAGDLGGGFTVQTSEPVFGSR